MNRLGKAKAIAMVMAIICSNAINAENIRAEEIQVGYDRFMNKCIGEESEKKYKEINLEISFYTSLIEENGTNGLDANGNPLEWGTLAIPRNVPMGTKFEIEGYKDTIFVGRDVGNPNNIRIKEDGTYRVDMFIPKKQGETNAQYKKRVNNYGKVKRKGKIILD